MIDKKNIYALIGASNSQQKYGYKVFKDLIEAGFTVIPVNPNEKNILGKKVYPTLSSIKKKIDVVIFVVPPMITQKILEEVIKMGIKNVWMQPGSQNDESIKMCLDNGINCMHDACIMIQKNILVKK